MENIIISNPKELEKTIKRISKAGKEKLHVVSDFDRTLTKAFADGERVTSVINFLMYENYLTEEYSREAKKLLDKYHPIETNPAIPLNEKKKAMLEWWEKHFKLLIKSKLNKKHLEKVLSSDKIQLRKGAEKFLEKLKICRIPLVIISSNGLGGDVIEIMLSKTGKMYDNIHLVSNKYNWDKNGYAVSIQKPIIHSMNKDETEIKKFPFYDAIKNRKNIILFGDSIEDMGMVNGFDYDNLIKIGFMNFEENKLDDYKKVYDVIILNDGSFDYVNELLERLIKD